MERERENNRRDPGGDNDPIGFLRDRAHEARQDSLNVEAGSGTSPRMDPADIGMIDAKVAAAEARTDAKFAQVIAKLDVIASDGRNTRATIWTVALGLSALIIGMLSYGSAQFYNGTVVFDHKAAPTSPPK